MALGVGEERKKIASPAPNCLEFGFFMVGGFLLDYSTLEL